MSKTLVVGGSGFIGSYLMKEIEADNIDLRQHQDVCDGIDKKYETIIFLACNQANTLEAYEYNKQMYEVLNDYNKRNSQTYLIYISSAAIYNPNSLYSMSKFLGETYAKRFNNNVILRLSNVYGHGDGHGAPDRFMRGEKIIHGGGNQIRDLIPVERVVSIIIEFMHTRYNGIFNVSSGRGTTVNEMFKMFGSGTPKYVGDDYGVKVSILQPEEVEW
jgi:nucleoside-diphosphate-sugar epimerase